MRNDPETLGLIAGALSLPLILAGEARKAGVQRLVAAAIEKETDPHLEDLVDEIEWFHVGQLGRLVEMFKRHGVTQYVMAGRIAPKNLFDLRPDLRALKLLSSLRKKNAHSIFGGVAEELSKDGLTLIKATPWLQSVMPQKGFKLGPELNTIQQSDIEYGLSIAKETSKMEIGQLVVVKEGTVLAVEGFEGTDQCLRRGGQLAGKKGGAIAVKVAKENHDLRFDIPCLGERTLEVCASVGIQVIAFEAGRTLLLDREAVEALAQRHKITVTAV